MIKTYILKQYLHSIYYFYPDLEKNDLLVFQLLYQLLQMTQPVV